MITKDQQVATHPEAAWDDDVATAYLTADLVLTAGEEGPTHVLLIKRGDEPFAGCWALPGGYLKKGETFEDAARREFEEEVGLVAPRSLGGPHLLGAPDRDPRDRVVSAVFVGHFRLMPEPTAGDDACEVHWFPIKDLPQICRQMAFDHAQALLDLGIIPEESVADVQRLLASR